MFEEPMTPMPKVTRVEVVDSTGRVYTEYYAIDVVVSIQDAGRTLKVFLSSKEKRLARTYE